MTLLAKCQFRLRNQIWIQKLIETKYEHHLSNAFAKKLSFNGHHQHTKNNTRFVDQTCKITSYYKCWKPTLSQELFKFLDKSSHPVSCRKHLSSCGITFFLHLGQIQRSALPIPWALQDQNSTSSIYSGNIAFQSSHNLANSTTSCHGQKVFSVSDFIFVSFCFY
jgi:hypothetical protein